MWKGESVFKIQLQEEKKRCEESGRERLDLSPAFSRHRGGPGLSRLKHLGFREGRVVTRPSRTSGLETWKGGGAPDRTCWRLPPATLNHLFSERLLHMYQALLCQMWGDTAVNETDTGLWERQTLNKRLHK